MEFFFRSAVLYVSVFALANVLADVERTEDERNVRKSDLNTGETKRNTSSDIGQRKRRYLFVDYETIKATAGLHKRKKTQNNTQSSLGFEEENEKSGFVDRKIHGLEVNLKSTDGRLSQQINTQQGLNAAAINTDKIPDNGRKKIGNTLMKKPKKIRIIGNLRSKLLMIDNRRGNGKISSELVLQGIEKTERSELKDGRNRFRIADDYRPGAAEGIRDSNYLINKERSGEDMGESDQQVELGYMKIAQDNKGKHGIIGAHGMIPGEIREQGKVGSHRVERGKQGGLRIEASTESREDKLMESEGIARMRGSGWRGRAAKEETNRKMRGKKENTGF